MIEPHYLVLKEEAPHRLPAEHPMDVGLLGAQELEPHPEPLELPGDVRQHPEDLKVQSYCTVEFKLSWTLVKTFLRSP